MANTAIYLIPLIVLFFAYAYFDSLAVFFTGAKIDKEASEKLGLNKLIYLAHNKAPFSFALSANKILITTGLRNLLNKQELDAIISRELFNIKTHKTGLILLFDLTSWEREFAADSFAAQKTSDPDTLVTALTKVGRISSIYPPVEERIKLLRQM